MNKHHIADAMVIGAGPAGMMSAIQIAQEGFSVILAEKQARPGIKLLMTGNGRCNLSNALPMEFWEDMIPRNFKFLSSAFYAFSNEDLCKWMESRRVKLISDQEGRLFPESNSAKTILSVFEAELSKGRVNIIQQRITSLQISKYAVQGVAHEDGFIAESQHVVLCCGGKSWPQTGSNGEGYDLAQQAGHHIIDPTPSLTPLAIAGTPFYDLAGTSLSKVTIRLLDQNAKETKSFHGPLLLTHQGISGPTVLNLSAFLSHQNSQIPKLLIDWLPDLSEVGILQQWAEYPRKKTMKQWLVDLKILPQRFCQWFLRDFYSWQDTSPILWARKERFRLLDKLKRMPCEVSPLPSFNESMVTSGGVSVQEISPKTMESLLCRGLYFAGEVMDLDALTGGFNLQIALSTGFLAGRSVVKALRNSIQE
jgi:predicted Rossmann fold flavoprotein